MLARRQKAEEAEKKRVKELEDLTDLILYHGLWQSHQEIDRMLLNYSSLAGKKEALKVQLKFRKQVLRQSASLDLFQFSKKNHQYSVSELADNLKVLQQSKYLLNSS
jgi:hypothetical protein